MHTHNDTTLSKTVIHNTTLLPTKIQKRIKNSLQTTKENWEGKKLSILSCYVVS